MVDCNILFTIFDSRSKRRRWGLGRLGAFGLSGKQQQDKISLTKLPKPDKNKVANFKTVFRPQSFLPDDRSSVLSAEEIQEQTNTILNEEKFQTCSEEYKKGLR